MQTWRKAYGALKDSTKVGLAKINSEFKDIDVAIVKATSHLECPPKERHVRKIFAATSSGRPGADASYCVHKLARRLAKTRNWTVALKTLIVFHRILRDGSLTFREELLNYADRGHIFHLSNFADYSSPLAWECSAWVRTYALFLEERLECLRILKFDVEAEQMIKSSLGSAKGHSRMRELPRDELLEQLPALQQLLFRLVGCQPDVAAFRNYLIQYSLALVLKESFKIYCAINDGIINLVDMFFEMSRDDAMRAFNIYKRAGLQAENLSGFYEFCKGLEISRNFQFPSLKQPPPSFLMTMEEYIKEAARGSPERALVVVHREGLETATSAEVKVAPAGEKDGGAARAPAPATIGDLLGLEEISPAATQLEDSNALALAVISPPEIDNKPTSVVGGYDGAVYGWELALVSAPSCINSSLTNGKLAGGFDRHLLDSLYDEAAALQHRNFVAGVQPGLNPFALPLAVAPPLTPPMPSTPPSNPFLDPFFPAVAAVPPPQSTPSLL